MIDDRFLQHPSVEDKKQKWEKIIQDDDVPDLLVYKWKDISEIAPV
ncbi:hypothetical protein [Oceanobacillus neutriphilus]|uniref:Uncharacterized protein n=1 Tax=Oceanobacillus neutriphilus TaxID=531815 RepID=A0ABQ2NX81_9BACI|nr:hypothetical protein [Oceanobacillus neutriphilus]GGP12906.1 hypothetical protein GCM10011346_30760 [Oceanobacillus neutriphilus]